MTFLSRQNITIINTRPVERATALSEALREQGYQVLELPLLVIKALPLEMTLIARYQQLLDADMVIAVSSSAVHIGMQYYRQLDLPLALLQQKQWIAVGKATQRTLSQYGITAVTAEIESSEGLLQLPLLAQYREQCVAFWRGIGGRELLMDTLRQQNCQIINMQLYTRGVPSYDRQLLEQIKMLNPVWVIISSEYSFENWLSLFNNSLNQYRYLVLGERVTKRVNETFKALESKPRESKPKIYFLNQLSASAIRQIIDHEEKIKAV